jgi:hypothetical protein
MIVTAPFAGPVSFPLLVSKVFNKNDFDLKNSCKVNEPGDVVLDSITNVAKIGLKNYKVVAGVYVKMYSILGNRSSDKVFTIRRGTLADYNARLYALITGKKEVINTTAEEALRAAEKGEGIAIVGIEVRLADILEEEFEKLGYLSPQCVIYSRVNAREVLKAYEEGIKIINERPEEASAIIASASDYYTVETMRRIIRVYSHRLTTSREDLEKSLRVYRMVEPLVGDLKIEVI